MKNMAFLELLPVLLALILWAKYLENKKIKFYIDNLALVNIVNKRTSRDKQIMKLIRPMVLLTMQHNILFKAFHIETSRNKIADALSPFQMARFRSLAQKAESVPESIPEQFLEVISQIV